MGCAILLHSNTLGRPDALRFGYGTWWLREWTRGPDRSAYTLATPRPANTIVARQPLDVGSP